MSLSAIWHTVVSGLLVTFTIILLWLVVHVAALPTSDPPTIWPTPLPTATPGRTEHCTSTNQIFTQNGTGETFDLHCVPLQH